MGSRMSDAEKTFWLLGALVVFTIAMLPKWIRDDRESDRRWREFFAEKDAARKYRDIPARLDKWQKEGVI